MKEVAAVLPQCFNLSEIGASECEIGPEEMGVVANVLPYCQKLKVVNVGCNDIGSQGRTALKHVLPLRQSLRKLHLERQGSEGKGLATYLPLECKLLL